MRGEPILELIVRRLQQSTAEVVITNNDNDPEIRAVADKMSVRYVTDESRTLDVMAIHAKAALVSAADFVCLAGADDPLLDPDLFNSVISRLAAGDVAYVKTTGWPLGLNVWGLTAVALQQGDRYARAEDERQHVVPYFERRPRRFAQAVIPRIGEDLYGAYRVTVDTQADLAVIREIYSSLPSSSFDASDVIAVLRSRGYWPNEYGLQGTAARDAIYDITPINENLDTRKIRDQIHVMRLGAQASEYPDDRDSAMFNKGRDMALMALEQWLETEERRL